MATQTWAFQVTNEHANPFNYKHNKEYTNLCAQAITMDEILPLAGLNWTIHEEPMFRANGNKVRESKVIIRDDTDDEIATVGKDYKMTQNADSLSIMADLLGDGVTFAGGGSFRGGRSVWLQAHVSEGYKILDDDMDDYIVIKDTHDGSGSLSICMTPRRIWCLNCINPAFKTAKRRIFLRHTRNIMVRLDEAREILFHASQYRVELAGFAEEMFRKKVSDAQVKAMLNSIFPVTDKSTELVKRNAEEKKEAFYVCYAAPDIAKFQGTAWGVINAASDLVCHSLPHKNTQSYEDYNFESIMSGHPVFDKVVSYLA